MPVLTRPTTARTYDQAAIAARMRRLDGAFRTRWTGLMFLGFVVVWIGPAIFTLMFWNLQLVFQGYPTEPLVMFAWCCGVGIPLLFLLEYATRGQFYDAPDAPSPDSMGGDSPASRAGAYALVVEISLWGPRMVITGFKRLRDEGRFGNAARKTGAQIATCLLNSEEGALNSGQIFTECKVDGELFADALAYLTFHDRVGISKDGLRIWIASEARRRLER